MVGVLMVLIPINPLTLDEHDSNPPCFHGSPKFARNNKPRRYCTPSRNTGSVASIQSIQMEANCQPPIKPSFTIFTWLKLCPSLPPREKARHEKPFPLDLHYSTCSLPSGNSICRWNIPLHCQVGVLEGLPKKHRVHTIKIHQNGLN